MDRLTDQHCTWRAPGKVKPCGFADQRNQDHTSHSALLWGQSSTLPPSSFHYHVVGIGIGAQSLSRTYWS